MVYYSTLELISNFGQRILEETKSLVFLEMSIILQNTLFCLYP